MIIEEHGDESDVLHLLLDYLNQNKLVEKSQMIENRGNTSYMKTPATQSDVSGISR